jgi:hypothetical protein
MSISATTIGNIVIENNYPSIDIVENFYISAKERRTLYTVVAISKGVYTFISEDRADFDNDIFTNGTFTSAQAAAEAAFALAVQIATELEAAFAAGYPEAIQIEATQTEIAQIEIAQKNTADAELISTDNTIINHSFTTNFFTKMEFSKLEKALKNAKTLPELATARFAIIEAAKKERERLENEKKQIDAMIDYIDNNERNLINLCELKRAPMIPMPTLDDEK